ncbi:CRISPR-associated helicase Cas3' [Desulfuromonas thiophila]|uniref:CRISPR-associated helicase Cas3' n=1 Tax=Desulfuromonas thiophila TaxID=57664 RepID=UPI0029F5094F|nr:CRISPR-associated helicase Cas3' [Desulfuromonas thiophila]
MGLYYRYWGKAEKDGSRYHLLPYHCLDVAAVGWVLLDPEKPLCWRLAKQLGMAPVHLQRWVVFFLCLHDIGKFAVVFQGQVTGLSDDLIKPNVRKRYDERHDSLGYCLWKAEGGLRDRLEMEDSCFLSSFNSRHSKLTFDVWMQIVTGHHGIPPKPDLYLTNYFDPQDMEAAWQYLLELSRMFINDEMLDVLADKAFCNRLKSSSWVLAGLVVLADWLGSSRQPGAFCHQEILLDEYWQNNALLFAKMAVEQAQLAPSRIAPYLNIQNLFAFISTPTPLQQWAEKVELVSGNQLFILEDVTGAGKTEAALILAHRLMANGFADGLYVALPTMATSNAMYERLGEVYRKLYADDALPSLVLAHGARHLSEAFRKSLALSEAGESRKYDRDEETIEAVCSAWLADSRKKALLAEVGVGTLDQVLLAVLPARHQSLRCLGLARKILIIDEVHAYDPYMNRLLQSLLEYHAAQGGSVIMLSATLPFSMRTAYLNAYCRGTGTDAPVLKETELYPLVTHFPSRCQAETGVSTRQEVERTVSVVLLDTVGNVLERIRQTVEQGQCVCWVRNTVGDAVKAYRLLATQEWLDTKRLLLFHSRFAMIDRQRIELETLSLFGKESTAEMRRGRVLIATQVVEQSLDLDFDLMISDLAPIDLLIQRMGREHRHVRDADGTRLKYEGAIDKREAPVFCLYGPAANEAPAENWLKATLPGTQAVYQNVGQLWLTQQLLAKAGKLSMPGDARNLIEGVYSDDAQATIPVSLQKLSDKAEAEACAKSGIARMNALKRTKGYSLESAEDSGGWEEETKIPTRLGDDTVRVALVLPDGETWRPYADGSNFAWDMSVLSVPQNSWIRAKGMIPAEIQGALEKFKEEVKAIKWIELFPLTTELSSWYDRLMGWGIQQEESADESD